MPRLTRELLRLLWKVNGHVGRTVTLDLPQKATVLITYYHPARTTDIEDQLRNVLKCSFVDRLVVSNHNPDLQISEKIRIRDNRLTILSQDEKRGCGYRWLVANEFASEYLIVIDDDILFFPKQLAQLFQYLIREPEIPHGVAGMMHVDDDGFAYYEQKDTPVEFLCEVYAVTGTHLKRYLELRQLVAVDDTLAHMIDSAADFMVISQTGSHSPKIHDVGRLFKSSTFKEVGVAVHKEQGFDQSMNEVYRALGDAGALSNR